jgi:hypothetical protein
MAERALRFRNHETWKILLAQFRAHRAMQADAIEVLSRSEAHVEVVARAQIELAELDRQCHLIEERLRTSRDISEYVAT